MKYDRKYTKLIVLVGIVLIGVLILAGVLYKPDTSSYEVLRVDNGLDIPMVNSYRDPAAPEQATVTFNGATYIGTYYKTGLVFPRPYRMHEYHGTECWFYINCDTGELISYISWDDPQGASTVDKQYCRKLADSIADDYLDLDEYFVEEETTPLNDGKNYYYTRTYYKKFNGHASEDRFLIKINGNGQVRKIDTFALGSFSDVRSVSVNEKKAKDAIREKLEEIYAGTDVPVEDFVFKSDGRLIKLEDGSCAVYYEGGEIGQGLLTFAVKVDYRKK
jgi:hypothetical protein